MDNKYWDNYYQSNSEPFNPSSFAYEVLKSVKNENSLIDIGCGNGRDSIFFAEHQLNVLGVDQSSVVINNLKKYENEYLKFEQSKFSDLKSEIKFNYAYCRFIFHSINELEEESLLHWLINNINKNIFIEARVDIDQDKYMKTNHYRRLMNVEDFSIKLKKIGFVIESSEISNKFSLYSNNYKVEDIKFNPMLARIILRIT